MRYAGIIKNDFAAAPGVCTSFFTQGCPHQCPECHNPETWDFQGGKEFNPDVITELIDALQANGIKRKLCIMGGEPLCPENQFLTYLVIKSIKDKLPDVEVYIWTGYNLDKLIHNKKLNLRVDQILELTTCVIDGPYIAAERDITLAMRGSRNQRILYKVDNKWVTMEGPQA